jgi:hypothetical protein
MKGYAAKRWIHRLTAGAALAGGLLTGAGALRLGLSLPTAAARALVVAAIVYMLIALGARLLGALSPEPPASAETSTTHQSTGT